MPKHAELPNTTIFTSRRLSKMPTSTYLALLSAS